MEKERSPRVHDTLARQKQDPVPPEIYLRDFADPDPDGPTALNVDFYKLLRIHRELEQKPRMADWEVDMMIGVLEERGELEDVYARVIDRIKEETGFFHEYEEIGLGRWIFSGFAEQEAPKARWAGWSDPISLRGGYLDFVTGKPVIEREVPDKREFLHWLAERGNFPPGLEVLVHEMVHLLQVSKTQLFLTRSLIRIYDNWRFVPLKTLDVLKRRVMRSGYRELCEAQAYLTDRTRGFSRTELIKFMQSVKTSLRKDSFRGYAYIEIDKLIYAVAAIEQLDALGLSVQEIARLVTRPGKWDRKRGVYSKVQKVIEAKAGELGLGENDLENLVFAHRIERNIDWLRAIHIVQEELRKVQIAKALPREEE